MNQTVLLGLIIAFYLCRAMVQMLKGNSVKPLLVSFFIFTAPFEIIKDITAGKTGELAGTLPSNFQFNVPVVLLILVFLFFFRYKVKFTFSYTNWVTLFSILLLISLINPYNLRPSATLAFGLFFFSHILLFQLIYSNLSVKQIINGIYDGFMYLCVFQLILAICFPILNMESVTGLFHEGAKDWSTRQGNRSGAVGVFEHPGSLALFLLIASSFFLATYLDKIRTSLSLIILILNGVTIILTYSRTAYIAYVIVIFALYFINKNAKKNIFSVWNIIKILLPITVIVCWIVFFSPFSDQFLKEDSSTQYDNRMVHWLLALVIFTTSPYLGVGINSHLAFLDKHSSFISKLTASGDFYLKNPIHNIHLIVLCETGILGFILWVIFLFRNIALAKKQIGNETNRIMSLSLIGLFLSYLFYGVTGWAPFSQGLLPFFLFVTFFAIKFRTKPVTIDVTSVG